MGFSPENACAFTAEAGSFSFRFCPGLNAGVNAVGESFYLFVDFQVGCEIVSNKRGASSHHL
jgi:hypothetical protein